MDLNNLKLDKNLITKLKDNNINSIEELWNLNRKELKKLNFNYDEINSISIKLQLKGLDLNKKRT